MINQATVQGFCSPKFEAVKTAFANNFDKGLDLGASLCVMISGEPVVDIWGGHIDDQKAQIWSRDTIVNVYSTGKTMTGLACLLLSDRGDLNLDAPVATYWPEFSAAGKSEILVRHLLGHTAGLPGWDESVGETDLYDWDKMTGLLAAQAPWWQPGTASGYHAVTQGFLIGEVIRRITGQTFGTFFAKEIAGPLGADFHIGLPRARDLDLAPMIAPPARPGDAAEGMALRVFRNPYERAEWSSKEGWRRAEVPASNGMGNARSIAQIQSVLACGGILNGKRLMSERVCEAALQIESNGVDLVVNREVCFARGYKRIPTRRILQGGGWGGSYVSVDLEAELVIAFTMNKMLMKAESDSRIAPLVEAIYDSARALGAFHPDLTLNSKLNNLGEKS